MKQSKATVRKRQNNLLALFDESGNLLVNDACKKLGVSPITIRRDLEALEQEKRLVRYHGGARLLKPEAPSIPELAVRGHLQLVQKLHIAKYAATLVTDERKVLFFNAGTTTYLVMKELIDRKIRIFTNNVHAIDLFGSANAELIMTGGLFNAHNRSFQGDLANLLLSRVHADMCILGVNGINSQEGITSYSYQETLLNQTMVKRCIGKRVVVADGTKIGKFYCYTSVSLEDIDILVTDSSADACELDRIRQAGVEVVLADL